jgi:cytochrome c-type biogenesis protein CcmE
MDAIKLIIVIIIFLPLYGFGQKSIYPKDTIYVKYEDNKINKKWQTEYSLVGFLKNGKYISNKEKGIAFSVKDENGKHMSLFYSQNHKADTLCIKHMKNYKFSNLKEINKKRYEWIFDNKRPPADKNGVFQTYLIEIISNVYFVIYPVIWTGEGVTD